MNLTTRTNQNSRRGVTLLLTISMIVLFLLMGTAFVIVANDYFKTSKRRSYISSFRVDSTALLDRAFYDVFRGADLGDTNSPMRGVDLLSDVYGYGVRGTIGAAGDPTLGNGLVIIRINNAGNALLTGASGSLGDADPNYVDGILNGRVISFTSGVAKGYSTRIVSHALDSGGELDLVIFDDNSGVTDWREVGAGDEYIINGREYSGTGAGSIVSTGLQLNPDDPATARLEANSLRPNQIGVPRPDLTGSTGYLPSSQSVNEAWDAPGPQNIHLSGRDGSGNIIPSFHRHQLFSSQGNNSQATMRPASTSNADFGFDSSALDVDTDGDGELDSVWIDIGLPVQTDDQGRKFRPLVAYRIIDMDGRLNLNACGSQGEREAGSLSRYGAGIGASDISLSSLVGADNYERFLNDRCGSDDVAGSPTNLLSASQKLFAHPIAPNYVGGIFSSALPFLSEGSLALTDGIGGIDDFPSHFTTAVTSTSRPYSADFSLGGGVGDNHFRPAEMESLLRRNDVDAALFGSRLFDDYPTLKSSNIANAITTDSFEIAIPARTSSILELLRDKIRIDNPSISDDELRAVVNAFVEHSYIAKEMYLGGRFNLNRVLGDGFDNDSDGVIDDAQELGTETQNTSNLPTIQQQYGTPDFDLNGQFAKSGMARQLYMLAMLASGDTAPSGYPTPTGFASADVAYRTSVAQWAVNVVDYLDSDSIMTVFEFDTNPFNDPRTESNRVDGNAGTTASENDRGVVIGLERPEILMTETIAVHDRQLEDLDSETDVDDDNMDTDGEQAEDGDSDWDSRRFPNSAAYIELYHPWRQTSGTVSSEQRLPNELGTNGVDLSKLAPDDTPVWRIVVHRRENASDPDEAVRSIYFADPSALDASARINGDEFFPSGTVPLIEPGQYTVIGSSGNVRGQDTFTFGQLTATMPGVEPTATEIADTRSIQLLPGEVIINDPANGVITRNANTVVIDSVVGGTTERGLSLSDPNGGYTTTSMIERQSDGFHLWDGSTSQPQDTPFDAELATGATDYHDASDVEAIWTNGISEFRVLRLQRLADPNSNFNVDSNPYVTVDVAKVDLLAFNGLTENPENDHNAGLLVETRNGAGVNPGDTRMGGIERGEDFAAATTARRMLFRSTANRKTLNNDEGATAGDGHNFSYGFIGNAGERLETLGARNDSYDDDTVPYGWLAWNNRPFANHLELAHVPMVSAEGLVLHFGDSESLTSPMLSADPTVDEAFTFFFGDDEFGHLPGFGSIVRDTGGGGAATESPNRFDNLLDFVEVQNRFLGSETYLPAGVTASGPLKVNLTAPHNFVPNFRHPGRVNINTIDSAVVWNAVTRGFGAVDFDTFRSNRNDAFYTTAQAGEFVDSSSTPRKGASANLFRKNGADYLLDSVDDTTVGGGTNTENIATFRNELRTRLGGLTTTRSSVYSIWITVGYFEVDANGLVGAELNSEDQVRRDRAFYMVDRSIPVAFEPGKNHNVDKAVLVRSIIE